MAKLTPTQRREVRTEVNSDPRVVESREHLMTLSRESPIKLWRAARAHVRLLKRVTREKSLLSNRP